MGYTIYIQKHVFRNVNVVGTHTCTHHPPTPLSTPTIPNLVLHRGLLSLVSLLFVLIYACFTCIDCWLTERHHWIYYVMYYQIKCAISLKTHVFKVVPQSPV